MTKTFNIPFLIISSAVNPQIMVFWTTTCLMMKRLAQSQRSNTATKPQVIPSLPRTMSPIKTWMQTEMEILRMDSTKTKSLKRVSVFIYFGYLLLNTRKIGIFSQFGLMKIPMILGFSLTLPPENPYDFCWSRTGSRQYFKSCRFRHS